MAVASIGRADAGAAPVEEFDTSRGASLTRLRCDVPHSQRIGYPNDPNLVRERHDRTHRFPTAESDLPEPDVPDRQLAAQAAERTRTHLPLFSSAPAFLAPCILGNPQDTEEASAAFVSA
ncbi:hypothetical protein [Streptomyces sp. NPDC058695]|uniref:hypothetical protein n=1 Tax=Streptomyces sp. NPDC058695 TaxID=3346604 RepID=UPI003649F9BF